MHELVSKMYVGRIITRFCVAQGPVQGPARGAELRLGQERVGGCYRPKGGVLQGRWRQLQHGFGSECKSCMLEQLLDPTWLA